MSKELVSIETIYQFIVEELLEDSSIEIMTDEDLLLSGFLDSINVIRLVSHLEEKSALNIPPEDITIENFGTCLLYTSPSPRDATLSRMPSSA